MGEGSDAQHEGYCRRWSGARGGVVEGVPGLVQHHERAKAWRGDDDGRRFRAQVRSFGRRCRSLPHGCIVRTAGVRRLATDLRARRRSRRLFAFRVITVVRGSLRRGRLTRHRAQRPADRKAGDREQQHERDSVTPSHGSSIPRWRPVTRLSHDSCLCCSGTSVQGPHSAVLLSRRALPITDTELNVIAALATIGLSSTPSHG